jgi:opacity protein-like surface antigen
MPRVRRSAAIALLLLVLAPTAARADATAFVGITPTDSTRLARGFSIGFGLLIVGFEFEYSKISEDLDTLSPSVTTGMGNVLLQTPTSTVQLYGTAGAGGYRERFVDDSETSFATNLGGGAKIRLVGPLRLRLDYRIFNLQGSPRQSTYQRLYAGVNLAF